MESQLDPAVKAPAASHGLLTRGAFIAALIFVVLTACLYALSWNSESAGFLSDDAVYLLMADGFSPFRHADPGLTAYVMRETLFPPFYPLLLAVLGAGSGSLLWAHVITTTTLVLALGIYGLWINSEVRDWAPTIGLLTIFALAPGTLLQNLELLSEFPYLMLTLMALWLADRARTTNRGCGIAALCVGLATVTRTAGLSLLVAFAIWLLRHRVRGWVKWLAVALIPSATWFCYKKWALTSKGGYSTFWSSLWEQSQSSQGFVATFLERQGKGLWDALLNTLDFRPSHLTQVVLGVTLLVALPVWIRRLWLWRLDAWYLLIGGMMILLYPFPGFFTRLFLPWVPIVLFYAYLGVLGITAGWGDIRGKPVFAYAYLVALFLTLIPTLGFISHRLAEPIDPELANFKHTRYWFRFEDMNKITEDVRFRHNLIRATQEVALRVPEGECVFGVHTAISMLYSQRIFQQPPSPAVTDSDFERLGNACHYFFLVSAPGAVDEHRVEAFYPKERLSPDRIEIVQSWKGPREADAPTAILLRTRTACEF
jgi:hypothetical protein